MLACAEKHTSNIMNIAVRRSRLSGLTEPPQVVQYFSYLASAGSNPYTSLIERAFDGSILSISILYES